MTWMTNHNKAAFRGLVSQPNAAYIGYIRWQLTVSTLMAASADPVSNYGPT